MNKIEAIQALSEGKKIRYKSWWWGRYLAKRGGVIVNDAGIQISQDMFMTSNKDWEIYDDAEHGAQHSQE